MPLNKVLLNTDALSLYIENDKGLLFNHSNCSLYSLPAISVAMVLLFDEGLSPQEILKTLADKGKLPLSELAAHYQDVVDKLSCQASELSYYDGQYPELKALICPQKVSLSQGSCNTYQIANASFSLQGDGELLNDITALLTPRKKELKEVDFVVLIQQESEMYCIYSNDLLVEQCVKYQEVIPLVIDRLQILAFQKSAYSFCFHGAALSSPNGNLLLPGESGAGKSTLSALLMDEVHHLYSDEIIALDDDFQINVIPLPIAIKSGSWQVVSNLYPGLAQAKIWQRLDGRQLKYLWPDTFAEFSSHPQKDSVLIHPQYSDSKLLQAEVTELSVIETLTLLTASGYQLGFELNAEKLEKLIGFIQQTQSLRIKYSETKQVVKILGSL